METIATGWLVLEMTNSAWHVALIAFYRSAPLLVLGFFSGTIAARLGRRAVILCCQAATVAFPLAVVGLLATGRLAFWHLALGATLMGTAWAVDWPTRRSLLPDLIGRRRTLDGLLLEGFCQNIGRIAGPFLSGALIELAGITGCFAVLTGVSFLGLIPLFRLSPRTSQPVGTAGLDSPWRSVAEGMRYIRGHRTILPVLLITLAMNTLVFPYDALLPVFARDILGRGPTGLGFLGAASGMGSFLGVILISRVKRRITSGWIYTGGSLLQSAVLVVFAVSTSYPLSAFLLVFSGLGQACFGVMQSTIVLTSASDDMRDRAMGAVVLAIGGGPIGRLNLGAVAAAFGAPIAVGLSCAASALTVLGVTAAFPGLRKHRSGGDPSHEPRKHPSSNHTP
jgi:MFS family permease